MARHNKIFRGPVDKVKPQTREGVCDTAALPGTMVVPAGVKLAQSGANPATQAFLVQDNYLAGKTVDDAWPAGDRIVSLHIMPDELYAVRVPTGTNLTQGDPLTANAAGKLVKSTTGQRILFWATETYNNTSGADQIVSARGANTNLPAA